MKTEGFCVVLRSTLLALLLLCSGYDLAIACLFQVPQLEILCHSQVIHRTAFGRRLEEAPSQASVEQQVAGIFDELVRDPAAPCRAEFIAIEAAFKTKVATWAWESHRSTFWGEKLRIEPYSPEAEAKVRASYRDLHSCYYQDAERVGAWLFLTSHAREYCRAAWPCYQPTALSPTAFLLFQLTHPGLLTLPYLVAYLLAFILRDCFKSSLLNGCVGFVEANKELNSASLACSILSLWLPVIRGEGF